MLMRSQLINHCNLVTTDRQTCDWPSNDQLHHDPVWNHDPHHFLQHTLLNTERKERRDILRDPLWSERAVFVSYCLLTCLMRPDWCLRASVCRPERCLASPCCWPAEAAACRPCPGSLQEPPSPWDIRTHTHTPNISQINNKINSINDSITEKLHSKINIVNFVKGFLAVLISQRTLNTRHIYCVLAGYVTWL